MMMPIGIELSRPSPTYIVNWTLNTLNAVLVEEDVELQRHPRICGYKPAGHEYTKTALRMLLGVFVAIYSVVKRLFYVYSWTVSCAISF